MVTETHTHDADKPAAGGSRRLLPLPGPTRPRAGAHLRFGPAGCGEGGGAPRARAQRCGLGAPPWAGARGVEDRTERGKSGGRRRRRRRGLSPEGKWRIWRSSCLMRRR